ncbi:MAG: 50S ribosomal protein L34e [DPANN group archaeon]|nr:50S ribosomal protein L34e [DPANN group archaeon]
MVSGNKKSGRFRRIFKKTPGGKTIVSYEESTPKQAKCSNCSALLHGIPRLRPAKFKNLPKSQKRPERPYGGNLCSRCARAMIAQSVAE